jgi:hypothetical protein
VAEVDWNDPVTLNRMLRDSLEAERDLGAGLLTTLVFVRRLVARRPTEPCSPAAERLVIRAVILRRLPRGVVRELECAAFTCPRRRSIWALLVSTAEIGALLPDPWDSMARISRAWRTRPEADELDAELLETTAEGCDPSEAEARAAAAEVLADWRRREAAHAARTAARALERREDGIGVGELERAGKLARGGVT